MNRTSLVLVLSLLCLASAGGQTNAPASSLIPSTMSYQGLLTDNAGEPVVDGVYQITFSLYSDESGGVALWTEAHPTVTVVKGLFNAILGSGSPAVPLTLAFDRPYHLGIRIGGGPELLPRTRLTSTPYSLRARTADAVADGSISDAAIAPGAAIAASKLAGNVLTEGDVTAGQGITLSTAGGQVMIATAPLAGDVTGPTTATSIAPQAVTTSKLAPNAVTTDKIQPDILSGINGLVNDGGQITLVAGPNITIEPGLPTSHDIRISGAAGGGFSIPYANPAGQQSTATPMFSLRQSGSGTVAALQIDNAGSTSNVLDISNAGTSTDANGIWSDVQAGIAIKGTSMGTATPTIDARNNGGGPALTATAHSYGPTMIINNEWEGNGLDVKVSRGRGISITIPPGGMGEALEILNSSTDPGASGVNVSTQASKAVVAFNMSPDLPTIHATNSGGDAALLAHSIGNSRPTAILENTGSGTALRATNQSDVYAATYAFNTKGGPGLVAENEGANPTLRIRNVSANTTDPIISASNKTGEVLHVDGDGNLTTAGDVVGDRLAAARALTGPYQGGGYYRDNATVAWGHVQSGGALIAGFNVASVTRTGAGVYTVTLGFAPSVVIPHVTVVQSATATSAQFATLGTVVGTTFQVVIWGWSNTTPQPRQDSEFYFIVTGRP